MLLRRIYRFYRNHRILFFLRKTIYYLYHLIPITKLFLQIKSFFYFKTTNIKLGRNVRINGLPNKISIGKNCIVYDNCNFEFLEKSVLTVGENVVFSYGAIISCKNKINIGNDVQIGEYTSIRDSTHSYKDINIPIKYQIDKSEQVIIHDNVWIGRGCIIMPGTTINSGVIIGANSVVKGVLNENTIYAGSPAKLIKKRT